MNAPPNPAAQLLHEMGPLMESLPKDHEVRELWTRLMNGEVVPAKIAVAPSVHADALESLVRNLTGNSPVVGPLVASEYDNAFALVIAVFSANRQIDFRETEVFASLTKSVAPGSLFGVFVDADKLADVNAVAGLDKAIGRLLIADDQLNLEAIDPADSGHFLFSASAECGDLSERIARDRQLLVRAIELALRDKDQTYRRAVVSLYSAVRRANTRSLDMPTAHSSHAVSREAEIADVRRNVRSVIDDARSRAQQVLLLRVSTVDADIRRAITDWAASRDPAQNLASSLESIDTRFTTAVNNEFSGIADALTSSLLLRLDSDPSARGHNSNAQSDSWTNKLRSTHSSSIVRPLIGALRDGGRRSGGVAVGAVAGAGVAAAATIFTALAPLAVIGLASAAFAAPIVAGVRAEQRSRQLLSERLLSECRHSTSEQQATAARSLDNFFADVQSRVTLLLDHQAAANNLNTAMANNSEATAAIRKQVELCDQLAQHL
ncbi:MAG: hypothetical protein KF699_03155 [Phycisphaeraceae bacterium]|nr:hypothetical protein [Phycisphaeraceae bacterium]